MSDEPSPSFSVGQCATLACLWEATAPKVGNVYRGADFEDLTYVDFLTSAAAIAPAMEAAASQPLGKTVLAAVQATRAAVATNTNLGTVLLLAPLAAASGELRAGTKEVLGQLTEQDTADVYAAIRLAQPGGMGSVDEGDLSQPPPERLLDAMQWAADRDLVARQYACGFAELFDEVVPGLVVGAAEGRPLAEVIVRVQLETMAAHPDSLIMRKCGAAIATEAADRAAAVLRFAQQSDEAYHQALSELDFWLRSDGHRRNPGTTADLIAAGLFVGLRTGQLQPSHRFY